MLQRKPSLGDQRGKVTPSILHAGHEYKRPYGEYRHRDNQQDGRNARQNVKHGLHTDLCRHHVVTGIA